MQFAASKLDQVYPMRTPAQDIELFRSATPQRKYFEIGAVTACCSADPNAMIEELRKKASESGGDALIGLDVRASGATTATVIRYE